MTSPNREVVLMSDDQVRRVSDDRWHFGVPADALSRGYPCDAFVYSGISVFPLSLFFYGCGRIWSCSDRLGCSLSSFGRPSSLVAHSFSFIYLLYRRRFVCEVDSRNGLSILLFLLMYYDIMFIKTCPCQRILLVR